jgi:GDPmannose 4,6-dehydratase
MCEMQWLMLQQDHAARLCHRHRRAIQRAPVCGHLRRLSWALRLAWKGEGEDEQGVRDRHHRRSDAKCKVGDVVVKVDPRYFRPTEVETLLGDPTKAKAKLGWIPEITAQDMCREMVENDLAQAKQCALLRKHGFDVRVSVE